jgi:hypothetical protein
MEVRAARLEAQTLAAGRRRCERERRRRLGQGAARVWGSRLLRETTTVYVYCLIDTERLHEFI